MNHILTDEQITSYQDNGFLVVPNFLNADELQRWRHNTDEAVEQRLSARSGDWSSSKGGLNNQGDPNSYYAQVFTQCLKLLETHDGMREILLDPRLGEMAATLAGVDGIRVWHDQALFKPPWGNPTAWHLDNPYWSFSSPDAISLWVALDDATLANGCMWYLPGTHKTARYDNVGIGQNLADLFRAYPEWRQMESVAAPCPAGSAVFHSGLVAHGAGANMTPRPRRAMTCAYMPDGATFNGVKNVLPDAYFSTLTVGDTLDNNDVNPLVWRK